MKMLFHHILMCGFPLLLLFLLPAFGVSAGVTFTLFFILMFGGHIFMMRGHGEEDDETQDDRSGKERTDET